MRRDRRGQGEHHRGLGNWVWLGTATNGGWTPGNWIEKGRKKRAEKGKRKSGNSLLGPERTVESRPDNTIITKYNWK
jgi:hypothetical protein